MLIWGIGGGVATAALSLAKALGAHVVATSSSDEKLERALELGADAVVNHATGDVVAAVKEATGGGAHVVVDDVGEATWKRTLDAARAEGRIVVCGATTGPNPPAALHRVWWKQLSILGSTMGTPDDFQGAYDLIAAGKARPVVDRVFPLAEARAAHERLEAGRAARQDRARDPLDARRDAGGVAQRAARRYRRRARRAFARQRSFGARATTAATSSATAGSSRSTPCAASCSAPSERS